MRRSATTVIRSHTWRTGVPLAGPGESRDAREPVPGEEWRGSTRDRRRPLIVASNRLPVQSDGQGGQRPADGGLVRALEPLADRIQMWFGSWPAGEPRPGPVAPGAEGHDPIALCPVPIPSELSEGYYGGYANRCLWPWLHGDRFRTEHRPDWWRAYQKVNHRFARALALASPRNGLLWIHDYHLLLVPRALRALRPDLRIGFFLHTPFPAEVGALPPDELVALGRAVTAAHLIGFQTPADVERFGQLVLPGLSAPGDRETGWGRGGPHLVALPASIDAARFESLASDPVVRARAAEVRAAAGDRRIVLGVDRLDYTKAIPARLAGYERLLESGRVDPAEVLFVQVAVPSRTEIGAYATERDDVARMACRIESRFGQPDPATGRHRPAMRLHTGSLPVDELVAHYLAADVLVASPRRDGMNLVAKEYCAARADGGGVLVLSEGAGAARELDDAVLAADATPAAVAHAVDRALRLPADVAAVRMRRLHRHVMRADAAAWAAGFLRLLDGGADGADEAHGAGNAAWAAAAASRPASYRNER